jgi:hypothetical protein
MKWLALSSTILLLSAFPRFAPTPARWPQPADNSIPIPGWDGCPGSFELWFNGDKLICVRRA